MRHHAASGTLLILSALMIMAVMLHHPTGHGLLKEETFERTAHLAKLVHAVAIASTPVIFLGLLGAARRLEFSDLSIAALVAFGFAGVAVMSAGLASGFIVSGVVSGAMSVDGSGDPHALMAYTHLWNQAFAKVHLVAFSAGMILLGAALLRGGGRIRQAAPTGIAGIVAGLLALLLFFSGHVRLDVHGATILYSLHSAWLVWLGVTMCLRDKEAGST